MKFPHGLKVNALFVLVVGLFVLGMRHADFSDDQISYLMIAKAASGHGVYALHSWSPVYNFSMLLAAARQVVPDFPAAFLVLFVLVALLYLNAMYWCLEYFLKDKRAVLAMSLLSLVPRYTLGMTYWGFGGFEYLTGRMLFMPLAPVALRLFFAWRGGPKCWAPFMLCALGGMLSYEAFFLLGVLIVLSVLLRLGEKRPLFPPRPAMAWGIAAAVGVASCVYHSSALSQLLGGPASAHWIRGLYEKVIAANPDLLRNAQPMFVNRMHWEAAEAAFWWALFPPRWSDIGFAVFNAFPLVVFAAAGAWLQKKEDPVLFRNNCLFLVGVAVIAYGYQALRFALWKLCGWPPHVLEETRVFKFVFFPLFLWSGVYLGWMWRKRKTVAVLLSVALMALSPLEVLRSIPAQSKMEALRFLSEKFPSLAKEGYLEKLLSPKRPRENEDIACIVGVLQSSGLPGDSVLSDIHRLKDSGKWVIMSYQDKRSAYQKVGDRRYPLVVFWYKAWREVRDALDSSDPERIVMLAHRYQCRYAVTERALNDPRLLPLYDGSVYHLYEVRH